MFLGVSALAGGLGIFSSAGMFYILIWVVVTHRCIHRKKFIALCMYDLLTFLFVHYSLVL